MVAEAVKNIEKYRFILFIIFQRSKRTILDVVNWGEVDKEGNITYSTKEGKKTKTKEQIESTKSLEVVKFTDLNLKDSIYYWLKKNGGSEREIVVDMTIETGEVYSQNGWHLDLMIQANDKVIKIKPII